MKFQEVTFKLKNDKTITIRAAKEEDSEKLIKTAKSYIANSEHILMTDKEFNPTIEQEVKWIQSFINNPNSLLLLAVYDNEIIGNIDLTANTREKLSHTGVIGISIVKAWRGLGVGKALLESVIKWSQAHSTLLKLWLEVFANNENAIALYKKVGFIEEGKQKNFIKIGENKFVDNIIMGFDVK